jgi:hypothetical protein
VSGKTMGGSAHERDALLRAAIDFIGTLTGMTPPPIEVAPPEVFALFRAFVDRVQAITALTTAAAVPPVEPVAWRYVPSKVWGDYEVTQDSNLANSAREHGCVVEPLFTAPKAAPVSSDWDMRGHLAASLTCWHRLTGQEAAELVALFQGHPAQTAPAAATHIQQPYTLAEIKAKIASNDYSAELLLQHAMLLLEKPAAVAGPSDAEPLHITHGPLMRHAAALLRSRKPVLPDHESVAAELELAADGHPTPAGDPSPEWLEVAESAMRAAAPTTQAASQPVAQQGEPLVRYCPGCGSVGPVESKWRDCCPDGGEARLIPQALAQRCHDTFQLALDAALSQVKQESAP